MFDVFFLNSTKSTLITFYYANFKQALVLVIRAMGFDWKHELFCITDSYVINIKHGFETKCRST